MPLRIAVQAAFVAFARGAGLTALCELRFDPFAGFVGVTKQRICKDDHRCLSFRIAQFLLSSWRMNVIRAYSPAGSTRSSMGVILAISCWSALIVARPYALAWARRFVTPPATSMTKAPYL
jgi:hypothetical protein